MSERTKVRPRGSEIRRGSWPFSGDDRIENHSEKPVPLTKLQVGEKPPPFAERDRNQEHAYLWSQLVIEKNVAQNHRCRLFDLAGKVVLFVK